MTGTAPVLILADADELRADQRIWGAPNGVLEPGLREALDWLLLCRFLGWDAEIAHEPLSDALAGGRRVLIVARDPGTLDRNEIEALAAVLERERVLVVVRAGAAGEGAAAIAELTGVSALEPRAVSSTPRWTGPGPARNWIAHLELELPLVQLDGSCVPWAFTGSAPLVVARRHAAGTIVTVLAHPSELRDANPSGTGVLKTLLAWGSEPPVAWLELEDTLVLRMDDPGSAGNAHLRSWAHRTLDETEWAAIATDLAHRDARLTVGYVPGWIDDGDAAAGSLLVSGKVAERVATRVHSSPSVSYRALRPGGDELHDHEAEFRGLVGLSAAGAGDPELHGHTHVRRPHRDWAAAADRHENVHWYRELEAHEPEDGDPLGDGVELFSDHFGSPPTSLLCPGQACSTAAAEEALDAGLTLVATETLGVRFGDHLAWDSHVISPALGWPNGALLENGLPSIACLHDNDPVAHGAGWVATHIDDWRLAGARRFIDFRELAAALRTSVDAVEADGEAVLEISGWSGAPRAAPVLFRAAGEAQLTRIRTTLEGATETLVAESSATGANRVWIPVPAAAPA